MVSPLASQGDLAYVAITTSQKISTPQIYSYLQNKLLRCTRHGRGTSIKNKMASIFSLRQPEFPMTLFKKTILSLKFNHNLTVGFWDVQDLIELLELKIGFIHLKSSHLFSQ